MSGNIDANRRTRTNGCAEGPSTPPDDVRQIAIHRRRRGGRPPTHEPVPASAGRDCGIAAVAGRLQPGGRYCRSDIIEGNMNTAADTDKQRWERETLRPALEKAPERAATFTTISGRPIDRLYAAEDLEGVDPSRDIANPGEFPYTRGIHPTGYRGRLWTMRQFSGFGTPEESNARNKALLAAGGTGLSIAFDLPTLMGRDPDHELSLGEVGKCGVNVMSLADMETLFDGIAVGDITTSMTINSPAAMIFAMYLVVAEKQGASWQTLSGTIQNDILKEFIAQKEYIYPPRPSMRIVTYIFAFCSDAVPRWNAISVSGYHIREAGATALQELAFTLRDGIEYVQWCVDAGLDVDDFVPRISFFFNAHSDFFEEI